MIELNPEHKESRMLTLALILYTGHRGLLNWDLAESMAKQAQEFYEA